MTESFPYIGPHPGDFVSAYPKLEKNSTYGKEHRKARLPKWSGRHGGIVKGSVRWNAEGYRVVYSYLLGYESTAKASEVFDRWSLAIGQYREHDRAVRERKKLEDFRSVRTVL